MKRSENPPPLASVCAKIGASRSPGHDRGQTRRTNGDTTIQLPVKVVPASSQNCVAGWLGNALKVRVTACAERGKANAAVEATIAEALGIPVDSARVIRGKTSPRKIVEILGLSEPEVYRRLSKGAA